MLKEPLRMMLDESLERTRMMVTPNRIDGGVLVGMPCKNRDLPRWSRWRWIVRRS